ncbi:hypothetical protein LCGC14_0934830 [marine sediment metagenome]|uniref:Uncharacterized protein n=1 Tax=marine sediment metagenome TaxID=412755 RepID=A0A0F9R5D6_9ZZZZ
MADTEKVGFGKVLETLASRISRKAIIAALAMILIYMLAVNPTVVPELVFVVFVITGLAIYTSFMQWILDKKSLDKEVKLKEIQAKQDELISTNGGKKK